MRIKKGFVMREICGERIVMGEGIENIDYSNIISLNETAGYLWDKLKDKDFTPELMAGMLEEEYEVDHDTALADSKKLCEEWQRIGVAEE